MDQLYINNGVAWSIMYINEKFQYSRHKDLENPNESNIVIRIGPPNKKDICYRNKSKMPIIQRQGISQNISTRR